MPADVHSWSSDDLVRWLGQLRAEGRTPAGIAWYQRHAFVFVTWLFERDDLERDIRKGIARVSVPSRQLRTVTEEIFQRLVTAARQRPILANGKAGFVPNYWRNLALLHVLYSTGVRRSEAASLRFEDYDHEAGVIVVRAEAAKTRRQRACALRPGDPCRCGPVHRP